MERFYINCRQFRLFDTSNFKNVINLIYLMYRNYETISANNIPGCLSNMREIESPASCLFREFENRLSRHLTLRREWTGNAN